MSVGCPKYVIARSLPRDLLKFSRITWLILWKRLYFCVKSRRLISGADFRARSKRYISCDQYRRTCLNLQPDSGILLAVRVSRTKFANSVCTLRVSRSSRFYGSSSLLRYLTMWLRFGIIALAVRSFERRTSYRSVISNYTRDDRHVFAY